jgi:hypothetical protein
MQSLVIHLEVKLARGGTEQEQALEKMLVGCPVLRVVLRTRRG